MHNFQLIKNGWTFQISKSITRKTPKFDKTKRTKGPRQKLKYQQRQPNKQTDRQTALISDTVFLGGHQHNVMSSDKFLIKMLKYHNLHSHPYSQIQLVVIHIPSLALCDVVVLSLSPYDHRIARAFYNYAHVDFSSVHSTLHAIAIAIAVLAVMPLGSCTRKPKGLVAIFSGTFLRR